jgi:hypothetical protein
VTSIADRPRGAGTEVVRARGGAGPWLRAGLLLAVLALMAGGSAAPWAWLWLAVPGTVAIALLACWRHGTAAVVAVALAAVVLAIIGSAGGHWVWWIPAAALVGAWMGVSEEGAGPSPTQRALMAAPLLILAALLPWLPHYREVVAGVERSFTAGDPQLVDVLRQMGWWRERAGGPEKVVAEMAALRHSVLPRLIPAALFLWVSLLVVAGRALAARVARGLRWPNLSRLSLSEWRLPDSALWAFMLGLALLLTPWRSWAPTAWTLLLGAGLGYCVQGVAVVRSLLIARGVSPPVVVLTMLFVFILFMPYIILPAAALGLSDVWLDYRQLEAVPGGNRNLGDR